MAAGARLAGALGVPVERFAEVVKDPTEDGPEPPDPGPKPSTRSRVEGDSRSAAAKV
jgi:hypothetical protein